MVEKKFLQKKEKRIKSLGQSSDVYQRLIDSFAPHIQGQSLIKEAILLLIVGSNQRLLGDGSKIRGDINVFLVGDPGTAKSEMLKFVQELHHEVCILLVEVQQLQDLQLL